MQMAGALVKRPAHFDQRSALMNCILIPTLGEAGPTSNVKSPCFMVIEGAEGMIGVYVRFVEGYLKNLHVRDGYAVILYTLRQNISQ